MTSIYCISAPEVGRFKIGRTQNITTRLSAMQTGSPVLLQVVATAVVPEGSDPDAFEKTCRMLVVSKGFKHLRGEWFSGILTATDFALVISEASLKRRPHSSPAQRRSMRRMEVAARA